MSDNFRENLRSELDYQGLTVKELSKKTGVPKTSLECYLRTKSNMPAADVAVKIARVLDVSVEYLVTGEAGKPFATAEKAKNQPLALMIQKIETLSPPKQEAIRRLVDVM